MKKQFKLIPNKGFQLTFENGNTISVMFGVGNYCSNRNALEAENGCMVANTAEVAIWDNEGKWHDFGNDTVNGYITSNEVAKWIKFASTKKVKPCK